MGRHWTINGRFLSQPVTGVQRYGREIVRALDALLAQRPALARDLTVELLVPPGTQIPFPLDAIESRGVGRLGGHAWEQAVLPGFAKGGLLSLCNTGPLLKRKHIVCIHDTNTFNVPQSYSRQFRMLYRFLHPALGRTAQEIATVSDFSRGEIRRHGISSRRGLFVAPDGYEHALRWKPGHSAATLAAASRDTIVMIGSTAPHKNSGFILAMADRLNEAGFKVAVVGISDPRVFKVEHATTQARNVHWLGPVSDNELAALLRDSMCLAFPSLTEGFGLPALEAMAIGCPVVVSDRASLPEVCGDAALYAPPDSAELWLDRFMQLKNSEALRLQLVARGKAQASRFSWTGSAARYLEAMAEMDGLGGIQPVNPSYEFS